MKSKASITGTLIDEDLQMDLWTDVCIALQSLVSVGHQVGYVIQDDVNEYYGNETLRLGQALAKLWNAHATLLRLATYLECPLEEEEFFSREHCERLCEKSKASSQAFTDQLSESVNRMEKMRPAEIRRSAK